MASCHLTFESSYELNPQRIYVTESGPFPDGPLLGRVWRLTGPVCRAKFARSAHDPIADVSKLLSRLRVLLFRAGPSFGVEGAVYNSAASITLIA